MKTWIWIFLLFSLTAVLTPIFLIQEYRILNLTAAVESSDYHFSVMKTMTKRAVVLAARATVMAEIFKSRADSCSRVQKFKRSPAGKRHGWTL